MKALSNTYLFQLYQHFKALFVAVLILFTGTAWFALHSREEFPFMLYGMYSLKETAPQQYISYSIFIHGREIIYSNYPDTGRELITSTVQHYETEQPEGLPAEEFYGWLLSYINGFGTTDGTDIKAYRNISIYNESGVPRIISQQLLFDSHEN